MLEILLVILIILMFGGGYWGYRNDYAYGAPAGFLGLVLLVVLVLILLRVI